MNELCYNLIDVSIELLENISIILYINNFGMNTLTIVELILTSVKLILTVGKVYRSFKQN